jgi:hypothetical protein
MKHAFYVQCTSSVVLPGFEVIKKNHSTRTGNAESTFSSSLIIEPYLIQH